MGRLILIGLGLHDEKSLTIEALEACRRCDMLFAEQYTSILSPGAIQALEARIGKEIQILDRERIEDGSMLELANDMTVGLMVPGDPMTATTHVDLRIRAHEKGVDCDIVHGISALVAVPGILGLQHYKFGRTVTIPFSREGYDPSSPFEQILQNMKNDLHTLVLLDIQADTKRYMTANEGLLWIKKTAEKLSSNEISGDSLACVVARAGTPSLMVRADIIDRLTALDFGPQLHSIVVPGKLHFEEIEALIRFAKAPPELFTEE